MSIDPRYPIGKFTSPAGYDASAVATASRDISQAPAELRAATKGLDEAQLDTPYRDGGWTVRQLVHHVADSHLNAYCRFKLALTEDSPHIKTYEEARWAELHEARTMPIEVSLLLLENLHARWSEMLAHMSPADWERAFFHPEQQVLVPLWRSAALYAWHGHHHNAHVTALRSRQGW